MEIKENRYHKGKIYSIRSYQTDKIYIGSTCVPLSKRLSKHRGYLKDMTKNISSLEITKYNDNYIELLEQYPCKTKEELLQREGEWIRANKDDCVNVVIPKRTMQEYKVDNKETIDKKSKDYYEQHKEELQKRGREYGKEYYLKNREERLQKQKFRVACECGKSYTQRDWSHHRKTKHHLSFLKPNILINI
jgi:hypothetical protein